MDQSAIRNFCIIAHIDHGKSTLADRILENTGTVSEREMTNQVLDNMDLERERGITIKLKSVRLEYTSREGAKYLFNLIDTPGHVDFSYEVSRSLAACEGALLVVDATQGIEAQTLATAYMAMEHDLTLIPVINKIDLPSADPDRVKQEIEDILGLDASEALLVSAKTGQGVIEVLEAIANRIPPPTGDPASQLRALIFDSHYDSYRGAIAYVRVVDGVLTKGMRIRMMATGKEFEVTELGVFRPFMDHVDSLKTGEVGFVVASMRDVKDCLVGDTITDAQSPAPEPLPGYRRVKPMVYCGLYPSENNDYGELRAALEKLQLNDSALAFEPETSAALGYGFRCGFLGLLHMEVVQERLEREYDLDIVTTAPNVTYQVVTADGQEIEVDNPAKWPESVKVLSVREPFVRVSVVAPKDYVGAVMDVFTEKRGVYREMNFISPERAIIVYDTPLSEILVDFFDMVKSRTRGYASIDYEFDSYRESDLVKLEILINGRPVDALSVIVHRDKAQAMGRGLVSRLRKIIPRQMFDVPIQAAIGSRVIARETIKAKRKDVLAKCYGGDVTRKRKLLERQKEGKKRMKQLGNVEVPQDAFMAVLRVDGDE
ncbi:MAG: translation elongation factor 4 [Bacillota bacterium]|nr:elongation factor 4 [Bacillota bacterium]HOB90455.1 translation elongation factor 4 [Bacillota bacterium]HPZ53805.1 translation elongation factor 4 [Bacillota bacterium]HQD17314.1 translation elongation factor 4 [Bacillota bacterium]